MAGTIKIIMSPEEEQTFRAFQRLIDQQSKFKRSVKETASEFDKFSSNSAGSIRGMITGVLGLTGVIGVFKQSFQNAANVMSEASKKFIEDTREMIKTLGDAGRLMELNRFRQQESDIKKRFPALQDADFDTMLKSIIGASGPGLTVERFGQLGSEVARFEPIVGDVGQFAQAMALLNQVAPGKSAEDIADLAFGLKQIAGERFADIFSPKAFKAVPSLVEAGMEPEWALGMLASSVMRRVPPEILNQMAEIAHKDIQKAIPTGGKALTAEQIAMNQLAGLAPGERISAIQKKPELLGAEFAAKFKLLKPEEGEAINKMAQEMNLAAEQLKSVSGDYAFRRVQTSRELQAQAEEGRIQAGGRPVLSTIEIGNLLDAKFSQYGVLGTAAAERAKMYTVEYPDLFEASGRFAQFMLYNPFDETMVNVNKALSDSIAEFNHRTEELQQAQREMIDSQKQSLDENTAALNQFNDAVRSRSAFPNSGLQ